MPTCACTEEGPAGGLEEREPRRDREGGQGTSSPRDSSKVVLLASLICDQAGKSSKSKLFQVAGSPGARALVFLQRRSGPGPGEQGSELTFSQGGPLSNRPLMPHLESEHVRA